MQQMRQVEAVSLFSNQKMRKNQIAVF